MAVAGGMVELSQTSKQSIAKHLKAVFGKGEPPDESAVNYWLTTAADGKRAAISSSMGTTAG